MAPQPFLTTPATAQWDRKITHEDYNKILQGFRPQCMEDKWMILTDATGDAQSNTIVHIYFGWIPREQIWLELATGDPDRTEAENWATIVTISWKVDEPGGTKLSETKAKISAFNLCNNLMGCNLKDEEEEDMKEEDMEEEDKDRN